MMRSNPEKPPDFVEFLPHEAGSRMDWCNAELPPSLLQNRAQRGDPSIGEAAKRYCKNDKKC